jgi:DNA mismatch repair protein MutS2
MSTATREALKALEWDRWIEQTAELARSEPGAARIVLLRDPSLWARDLAHAQVLQNQTAEAALLLVKTTLWSPLQDLVDPDVWLEELGRGSVLELLALRELRAWLIAVETWAQLPREEIPGPGVEKMVRALMDPTPPLRVLSRVLTPEGELSERASPELARLYSEVRAQKGAIAHTLDQVLQKLHSEGVLQEKFSDVRDGRSVIPLKANAQGRIPGSVHSISASAQTVYFEPAELQPLNQRLLELQSQLQMEIYRILRETSKQIAPHAGDLRSSVALLAEWDAYQARARLAQKYSGRKITLSPGREFRLKQTAHPLLFWAMEPTRIIRNDLDLTPPLRALMLTGPNTGGKTVLLKTVGLAAACARTGFPFPGSERIEVPFFAEIFTDLGDAQSIERHLSSFSGHIRKFQEILSELTAQSLILLDELNSATDPEEGAALCRAFLEEILAQDEALLIATTHDPQLKLLAQTDSRIVNCGMEFDESSKTPTYRIVLGAAGRSRALEIAESLGFPARVLDRARAYVSDRHRAFEKLLAQFEESVRGVTELKQAALNAQNDAERLKAEYEAKVKRSSTELLEDARFELKKILARARDEVRETISSLRSQATTKAAIETQGAVQDLFREATAKLETSIAEKTGLKPTEERHADPSIGPGQVVRVPRWKSLGTVLEVGATHAKVALHQGRSPTPSGMRVDIELTELEALSDAETPKKPKKSNVQFKDLGARTESVAHQIDLRGKRFEEALSELENYLDRAYRNGKMQVTVVHGLGTGAIREGTRKLLSTLPYVKSYRDGGAGQGGSGATVVDFDPV